MDKILMGLERENIAITPEERRLLAYHEGGHAVVAAVLPNTDPIHKVTIVPRGQAMGDGHENVFLGYEMAQRREYSEETAREADVEIKKILKESYDRAVDLLQEHRDGLDRVAKDLLEKEEITGKEVLELVGVETKQAPVNKSASA